MELRANKKLQLYELIILGTLIVNLVFFLFDSFYVSVYTFINHVFVVAGFIIVLTSRKIIINRNLLIGYILLVLMALLVVRLNGSGSGVVLQFIWPLLLIVILSRKTLSKSFIIAIIYISKLFIILLVGKTLMLYRASDMSLFTVKNGYINPNSTGMILIYLLWFSTIGNKKSGLNKSELFWTAIVFVGVWFSESRTSLLVLVLTVVLQLFFYEKLRENRKILFLIILAAFIASFMLPFAFVLLYKSGALSKIIFLRKSLFTGREWIWMKVFDYFRQNPIAYIIGTGYNDTFWKQGSFNLHNAYIMLVAQYGLIITLGYFFFILRIVWKSYDAGKLSALKTKMVFIVLTVMLVGLAEVSFSYIPILIFPGIALGILNNQRIEEQYEHT